MRRTSKPNRNADPGQFMAPHNSIIEGFNIPRYARHPYHSKPSNSAPATIHPTPNVSREVSKASVECPELLHSKSSFQRRKLRALLEEPGEETVRVAKSGYAVQNYLQGRLYDVPTDSEVYRNIRGYGFDADKGKPCTSFNTIMLKRRKSNTKSVEHQAKQKSLERHMKQKSLERQVERRAPHVFSKSQNRYLEKEPSVDKAVDEINDLDDRSMKSDSSNVAPMDETLYEEDDEGANKNFTVESNGMLHELGSGEIDIVGDFNWSKEEGNMVPSVAICDKNEVQNVSLAESTVTFDKLSPIHSIVSVKSGRIDEIHGPYHNLSILEIIHKLYQRLNWPHNGILLGKCPQDADNGFDTDLNRREDDGEFLYCVPNESCKSSYVNPYDLGVISAKKVKKHDVYYTVSATYVSKVSSETGTTITPVRQWLHEREMYNKICNLPVFRKFRIWKTFTVWKQILRREKNEEIQKGIGTLLFTADSIFQDTLLKIRHDCESVCVLYPKHGHDQPQMYISLLDYDPGHTYRLQEFCELQIIHFLKAAGCVKSLRDNIIDLVKITCENYYVFMSREIDRKMKEIEEKEILQLMGQNKVRQFKNFQLIKGKYGITEHAPPDDPKKVVALKKKNPFKHVKVVQMKEVHERLRSFIRLVDFLIQDCLRRLILTAINVLEHQFTMSSSRKQQLDLYKLCGWKNDDESQQYACNVETAPTFEVDLVLTEEQVCGNSREMEGDSSHISVGACISPSLEDFEASFKNLFFQMEHFFTSFESFLTDPALQKYVENPSTGITYNFELGERFSTDTRYKNWPSVDIIFGGADSNYKGTLNSILSQVENGMGQVKLYTQQFHIFCEMVSSSQFEAIEDSLKEEWTSQQFYNVLNPYTEQISAMNNMPESSRQGMFLVKTHLFKQACVPYPQKIIRAVNKHLPVIAVRKNEQLLRIIKDGERQLSNPIKTVDEFVSHLSYLNQLITEIPQLEEEYAATNKLFVVAFDFDSQFSDEERASYKTLGPSFHQLKGLITYCEAKKDDNIQKFSEDLDSIVRNLSNQLHMLTYEIRNPMFIEEDMTSSTALENLGYLKDDLNKLNESAKSFAAYETLFTSALSTSKKKKTFAEEVLVKQESKVSELQNQLAEVEKDLSLRQLLWEATEEWQHLHAQWNATVFSVLDVVLLQKEVSRFVQTIYLLEKSLPPNNLIQDLKKKIMSFKVGMPIMSSLRSPALKLRHWEQITEITGIFFKADRFFTLGKLMELDLLRHQEDILEVASQATNEAILEQMLNKVKENWKVTDLQLMAHSSRDAAIITGVDEILNAIDDSMVTLANIRGSRFSLPLQNQMVEWERKMSLLLKTFEEWVAMQRNWLYLESIFSAQDIQRQLPNEAKLFASIDKTWRDIMRRTMDNPNALSAATSAGLLDVLQACNSNLEKIHKSLEEYLETKRLVFARFYFLSNEELLDILSNSKNVLAVQPYLMKCFANVNKLDFDLKQRSPLPILGMYSEEKEYLELVKSIRARGQVEHWLLNFENVMFDTIKSLIKKAIPKFQQHSLLMWIDQHNGQVTSVVIQVLFARDVEKVWSTENPLEQLEVFLVSMKEKLDRLASHVADSMQQYQRNAIVTLLIILVHERDVVMSLLEHKVVSAKDFQWTRQLRYRWDDSSNNCYVDQSIASFAYGYEYLGCSQRLVITPLTDRCYLTLTGALHFYLGGAPSGPAGTGKSETVKDLAKSVGKQCIVFNCSEGLDYKMIGRFLSGLTQSGSWCCLDEFNRIDLEVLSVIAQQLNLIRSSKMSGMVRFMFDGKDIRLNASSGVFITMNPGYAGRVELPDNLKSLFRPVAMLKPDNKYIAEIILFSNGFTSAAELSRKLVHLYELAKTQLSQQRHYDFGLRAIKSLLVLAGDKNRNMIGGRDSAKEASVLVEAIRDSNYPKLIARDARLFEMLLQDVFPTVVRGSLEPNSLEKYIGIALRELQLQKWPSQVRKVVQLNRTLAMRHGVMLVGPTAGGKTTVRNILKKALTVHYAASGQNKEASKAETDTKNRHAAVDMVTINPKSVTLDELYGAFDSNTAEWTDGLLSSTVRRFVNSNSENRQGHSLPSSPSKTKSEELMTKEFVESLVTSEHQWLVLDGPVDTFWIENLNTMLDDSKLLCLANGERISMLSTMKILFEVDNLEQASPATISRCGMIYVDPLELGWQPYVKSWLRNLRKLKMSEEDRDHLWVLFDHTVEQGLSFLEEHQQFRLINVPSLSIVQMLCNLLYGFFDYLHREGGFDPAEDNTEKEIGKNLLPSNTLFGNLKLNFNRKNAKKYKRQFVFQGSPEQIRVLLDHLFVFCYLWSFGGHFDCTSEETEEADRTHFIPTFRTDSDVSIRCLFDNFLRTMFETQMGINLPAGSNTLYSYFVDVEKGQFMIWDHLTINNTVNVDRILDRPLSQQSADNTITSFVPTSETMCYSFLMTLLALNEFPVLLSGTRGNGKTVLINYMLLRLSEPNGSCASSSELLMHVLSSSSLQPKNASDTPLTDLLGPQKIKTQTSSDSVVVAHSVFSTLTTASKPKQAMKSKLVKRTRELLGTRHGEKVLLFIDDLNMPESDQYGSQPPLEVLREFFDYRGFYETKDLQWQNVVNISLIAAYSEDVNGQSLKQNRRLLQKFNTLCLPQPSAHTLHNIFCSQLSKRIDSKDFAGAVCAVRPDIISLILGVYNEVAYHLKATPSKSHYFFNLRDVSKIVSGLLQAHKSVIKTRDQFIDLAVHEMFRVFCDRLVSTTDQNIFCDIVADQLSEFLKVKWSKEMLAKRETFFGDFQESSIPEHKRIYQSIHDIDRLQRILEDYYDRFKLTNVSAPAKFIFFPSVCQHIVSAARVLRQANSHMLLLGIGGTGKKAVIQLACFLEFCEFVQPVYTKTYSDNDLIEDLRKVMLKAGLHAKKVVFYMDNRNIAKNSFLELVCGLMNSTDISKFFDNESKETIAVKLRSNATDNAVQDSREAIFEFFKSRVKKYLHIVLSTSPSGSLFQQRCIKYPSLVNNCTIDWYSSWSSESMCTVADNFLSTDLQLAMDQQQVAKSLVYCHERVEVLCQQFYNELRRHFYVTPKSFLQFLTHFIDIYKDKASKSKLNQERLISGLKKLAETNIVVEQMKTELIELGPKLEQKTKDTEHLLYEIEEDRVKVNKVRAVVKEEEEVTDMETKKVESIALDAQRDLDSALPQLEQATAALDSLNKYDIGEIRSYASPPVMVMTVLSAVCVTLGEKPDWPTAKQLLSDPGFLKKLINYDHQNVSDKIYTRVRKYTREEDFNPLAIGKISVACKSMCSWVIALENYTKVHRMVKPKQEKCREAQEALAVAREKLALKQRSLGKVEDQLRALEESYRDSVNQLKILEGSKALTTLRLERAVSLINVLTAEKDRWTSTADQLKHDSVYLVSEAIIAALFVSYLGPFHPSYRNKVLHELKLKLLENGIKVQACHDFVSSMTDHVTIQNWLNCGLPYDNHSTQNALIIENNKHWPFIIDPQRQAIAWIKGKEKDSNLKFVKAGDPRLLSILENSVRLGEVVVIENVLETLDPALDPILTKNLIKRGDQYILIIGETEIQYNTSFKLYLLSNIDNPKLLPELCIKVAVISFIVSVEGLTEQILSKVVRQENPRLENQMTELLQTLVNEKLQLTELEDLSLNLLYNAKGNVLDDEVLINTLDKSKITAEEIKIRVAETEATQAQLAKQREIYLPLAERGSLLYFIAADLPSIDSMYQFSLSWFLDLFCKCIDVREENVENRPSSARGRLDSAKQFASSAGISRRKMNLLYTLTKHDDSLKMKLMKELVTETFYKAVSYSLFARHQLLFSFYLAVKIQLEVSLTRNEYGCLLGGSEERDKGTDSSTHASRSAESVQEDRQQSIESFMTQAQWNELQRISQSLPVFDGLLEHFKSNGHWWKEFMKSSDPVVYLSFPYEGENAVFKPFLLTDFQRLLLIKILRPDQMRHVTSAFISCVMGNKYVSPPGFDLQDLYSDSSSRTPVMFILSPGSDPSSPLKRFVREVRGSPLHIEMISLGRHQGPKAIEAIRKAYTQKGNWVFLQNCHLALSFMPQLEEIVLELADPDTTVHNQFRLWLSTRPDPNFPVPVLQASMKVTVEPPPGVKSNLLNSFSSVGGVVNEQFFQDGSSHLNWKQLVFSVCLFHAVTEERKKFGALGWNGHYDFIAADLETALLTLQDVVSGSSNIPWNALKSLTGEIIYGGRVTDDWDQRCLQTLLERFYTKDVLEDGISYQGTESYYPPDIYGSYNDCINMIENLPGEDQPQIFGANENALYECNRKQCFQLIEQLLQFEPFHRGMINTSSSNENYIIQKAQEIAMLLPREIQILLPKLKSGSKHAPSRTSTQPVSSIPRTKFEGPTPDTLHTPTDSSVYSPSPELPEKACAITATLHQEKARFDNLLNIVHSSIKSLIGALRGEILISNSLEEISHSIMRNKVPREWLFNSFKSCKNLSSWVHNLNERAKFISKWLECTSLKDEMILPQPSSVWLPAFFYPQGFLVSVLQNHSREIGQSVDLLTFKHVVTNKKWLPDSSCCDSDLKPVEIGFENNGRPSDGINIFGLFLDGAAWSKEDCTLQKCRKGHRLCPLPEISFIPTLQASTTDVSAGTADTYECPLYQTSNRRNDQYNSYNNFVSTLHLPTVIPPEEWVLNGLAALCQTDD